MHSDRPASGQSPAVLPQCGPYARGAEDGERRDAARWTEQRMRRRLGCVGSFVVIALIIAAVFVVENGVDYLLYAPWAYGWFGQPTLTGTWEGTVQTNSGTPYALYLELSRYRNRRNGTPYTTFGNADIDGHVFWCAPGIRNATSSLYGHANRSASSVVLETQNLSHLPVGLFPLRFEGAWHRSTLALGVMFNRSTGHGYISGGPSTGGPVRATLHKKGYSAYRSACAHI